ncbi:hypothetical protein FKM82_026565, partial [Ascaphus truei]
LCIKEVRIQCVAHIHRWKHHNTWDHDCTMKGLPLSLGLVALFALCAQSDIPVQPDFQADKIVGKWYSIALASNSNSNWFQSKKQYMKMGTIFFTPTADGNLEVVATYPK